MYHLLLRLFGILLAFAALAGMPAHAQQPGVNNIKASLIAESPTVAAGETVTLAFDMKPDATWHGYWANPGDAGIGMTVEWSLPKGASVGELRHPVPHTLLISGIMNYVYETEYGVLVDFKVPAGLAVGTKLPITAKADWLACTDEICVPESGEFSLVLTVGEPASSTSKFDTFRSKLPSPLGSQATYSVVDDIFRLSVPYPAGAAVTAPYFFALTDGIVDYGAPQKVYRDGDRLIIETGARGDNAESITGLLKIGEDMGLELTANKGDVQSGGTLLSAESAGPPDSGPGTGSLWAVFGLALGGAVLGGLILNVFPCVFPILSLKAISLAKAGGDETQVRRESLAYTAGIMGVCIALGGLMLALRAAGEQVGWAFQLQDPRVIFVLLVLFTGIAFNLAGLFEIPGFSGGGQLAAKGGTKGAFWTGALAAFVATPCTGPFMAAAMGSALILPIPAALLVFAGLGFGLALPFLALGFIPGLRKRLPRPGAWMDNFRKIMAVPMFLTALALVWLLGQQLGVNGLVLALVFATAVALALWWLGGHQRSGGERQWLPAGLALAVSIAGLLMLPVDAPAQSGAALADSSDAATLPSEPFSTEKLANLRSSERPVFAYFTADWCITCKVNEATALQRADTAKAFAKANVAVLKGDWTRRDAEITRYLEQHGRSGVPLYVYYAPGGEAQILPQALTVTTLTDLVS